MGDNNLIDLGNVGDLAKPATVLIEKICSIFGPIQIILTAKAKEKEKLIQLEGEIQRSGIQRRAMERFATEELKKQINLESIVEKAIPQLAETSTPEEISNDWLFNFLDKCKMVSEAEMQKLWARILSGEANDPGTFSKRTINALSSIEQDEALVFTRFCSFCWQNTQWGIRFPLIFSLDDDLYTKKGINFNILNFLDDIGFISFAPSTNSAYNMSYIHQDADWKYFDKEFYIDFNGREDMTIVVGHAIFTMTGQELAHICNPKPVDGFIEYVSAELKKQGASLIEL